MIRKKDLIESLRGFADRFGSFYQGLADEGYKALTGSAQQKTIIITGCSSGIGAYAARALKARGWHVFATARHADDIAILENDGLEAFYLDYRDEASIEALVRVVLERTGGRLDALYNNGAYALPAAVEDLPVDALRELFEANFFGWHSLTRKIIPVMRAQGHGRIVHCSSILGRMPMKWRGAYVASKYALEGLMLVQRMELQGSGIEVSLIEPGPIATQFTFNAAKQAEKHIDMAASVHHDQYLRLMHKLKTGGKQSKDKLGAQAVFDVLLHALDAAAPRPHYLVTRPAKLGIIAQRLLPMRWFYKMLSGQS